jgi:peroxiredoxin
MTDLQERPPLQPGDTAPDFTLAAADRDGTVSLADYRGKTALLLATMRGMYCAFCRRHIAQLGVTRQKLQPLGVEVLAVVATKAERARLYYKFRPVGVPVAADPDLTTHRAFGVPHQPLTPEVRQVVASKYVELGQQLKLPAADMVGIRNILNREDGFEPHETDQQDLQRHGAQFVGQFLIDRDGIVRWVNIETAKEGLSGLEKFPTDEEFLAAARTLP